MPTDNREAPVACSLATADLRERLASIAELNASALRSHRRNGLELELSYDQRARSQVLEMVERERECCAFLRFDVYDLDDSVGVTIAVPDSAADAAEKVFTQFTATTPARSD